MDEAFRFHLQLAKEQVAERTRALGGRLKDGLAAVSGVRLVTPAIRRCRPASSAWRSRA
jgi:selenocysteine lyase/cysteine desulfurase